MPSTIVSIVLVLAAALTQTSQAANCAAYTLNGVAGGFSTRVFADFTTATGSAANVLSSYGLGISDYPVDDGFIPHTFAPDHVTLANGALNMKVSAYTGSGSILSSEIVTNDKMQYVSVRTVLKSTTTKGIVEGTFFYLDDQHEIDLEILSSTTLTSSPQGLTSSTSKTAAFGFDPTQDFHEYRIDWTPGTTSFFIDGVLKETITANVPSVSTYRIFNTWSNGDANWSNGPPTQDSTTLVRSIEIYKGYSASVSGTTCAI